jgi:D-glycero-alpha-D-manno-heptose-7-phosphate kinase
MAIVRARAPVRFCDLGGWTDIRIVECGYVLNLSAALYTHVTVETGVREGVHLVSDDSSVEISVPSVSDLDYDGTLDLLKAALRRSALTGGVQIRIRSDVPPASGLGSSAAVGVSAVAALSAVTDQAWLPHEVAREAQKLEVEELELECGVQDQMAAAYGGANAMEVCYPEARVFPVPIAPSTLLELEERLLLVYTGRSRFSSALHEKVIGAYQSGQSRTRDAFETLAECARRAKRALLRGDLEAFGAAINANWEAQKQLHPDITSPEVEALAQRAETAGAAAFKLNGAGGGGTATLLCRPDRIGAVRSAIGELGMRLLPAKLDFTGLQVWSVE